ncbi:MAG: lysylphosphatidylglycerol synthase transmembrane domain-containing protein [Pelobium sp.]
MKLTAWAVAKYIFLLLIGIGIIYFAFKDQLNASFFQDLKNANWKWTVFSGCSILIAHFFRSLRWSLMIDPEETIKPKIHNVFAALMIGYSANLIIPRAGELARCVWLSKKEKLNTLSLIGTVIAERIIDLLSLIIVILFAAIIYSDFFSIWMYNFNLKSIFEHYQKLLLIFISIAIILVLVYFLFAKKQQKLINKLNQLYQQLMKGVYAIAKIKKKGFFIIYTLMIWVFYILSSYFCFKVFTETAILGYGAAVLSVVAGSFGMIVPIQGGIGAYHLIVTECLVLLKIDKTIALEFATVLHAVQTLIVIIVGLLAVILGTERKSELKDEKAQ